MTDRATSQADNVVPARRGKIIALTVDTTARSYDLTALALSKPFVSTQDDTVYITMVCDSADVYYAFHSATASDLSDTSAVAAGAALAYNNAYAARLVKDTTLDTRINRRVDKFLQVKTASGTAILRFWASSQNTGV
jgi:hypothetical protein